MSAGYLKIGDFCEIYDGPHATPEKTSEGPYFLSISSLENGVLNLSKSARLAERDYAKWTRRVTPRKGDLLFSYETRLGEAALMPEGVRACLGRRMAILRPNTEIVIPEFLLYSYLAPEFQQLIASNTVTGATVDRISLTELPKYEMRIPDLDEQKKLVSILSLLDKKIEVNKLQVHELDAFAKLLYDYWFVQFDFPMTADQAASLGKPKLAGQPYRASGGKMVYNDTLKREIPIGWEAISVSKVLAKELRTKNVLSSETAEKGRIPVIDQSSSFICGFTDDDESVIKEIPKIVFGDHTRILKFINFPFARGADGTRILTSRECRLPQHLFYYQLLYFDLSNYGYARHFKFLKDQNVILPDQKVASAFEHVAESLYKKIKNNIFEIQELTQFRDWLLPMLMNGQITVG
jgi:type I restriction enzyme S subunit